MKVVLFCGGMGLRMRGFTQSLPKPMVLLGKRPVLWHLMSYYAHYGHRDFVLCLGYKGHAIREFFENTAEWLSLHAPALEGEARAIKAETARWNISFVDTGENTNIGGRLRAVRHLVEQEAFLANYSDGLTDCPVPELVARFHRTRSVATMLACRPNTSFHFVSTCADGVVTRMGELKTADLWVNAGFFVLSPEIFDYMAPGEELVEEPFSRLIEVEKLAAHPFDGFWRCVDTPKDLAGMETLLHERRAAWQVWRDGRTNPRPAGARRPGTRASTARRDRLIPLAAAHDPA